MSKYSNFEIKIISKDGGLWIGKKGKGSYEEVLDVITLGLLETIEEERTSDLYKLANYEAVIRACEERRNAIYERVFKNSEGESK